MTVDTAIFVCSICGEKSSDICVYCTKDACANHRCLRCKKCSDCCECEEPLSAAEVAEAEAVSPEPAPLDPSPVVETVPVVEETVEHFHAAVEPGPPEEAVNPVENNPADEMIP